MKRRTLLAASPLLIAACSALPDKPVRSTLYDFGPDAPSSTDVRSPTSPQGALVLADIEATNALESTALLYRLGYANGTELRPYAHARWSAPPTQLVRQRLRRQLGRELAVLDPNDAATLARGALRVHVLRVGLEEFSQLFDSPNQSAGIVRLRVTLLEEAAAGEKLIAQRSISVRKPAATPDAPGGVQALAAATDAAADEIAQWLRQAR